jgi:hypothetical protein
MLTVMLSFRFEGHISTRRLDFLIAYTLYSAREEHCGSHNWDIDLVLVEK